MLSVVEASGWSYRIIEVDGDPPPGSDRLVFVPHRSMPWDDRPGSFYFNGATVGPDGGCRLYGAAVHTRADEDAFLAGELHQVVEVEPRYLAAQLVLSGQPLPIRLATAVRVADEGTDVCPLRVEGRKAYTLRGSLWGEVALPLSTQEARFARAMIDAYPEPVGTDRLERSLGIRSPHKVFKAFDRKVPGVIVAGRAWGGYGFAGPKSPEIPGNDPRKPPDIISS